MLLPSSRWHNIAQAFDLHQYRCQNFKCPLLFVTVNGQVRTHVEQRVEYVDMKLTEARKHLQLLSDMLPPRGGAPADHLACATTYN
jgi:hypothetical protein